MRIVHVVALVSVRGAFGGPTAVALGQLQVLQARGHEVVLIGLSDAARHASTTEGVPTRLLPARILVPGVGMLGWFHWRLPLVLWREIGRADAVHVHAGRDLVSVTALAIAAVRRRRYVVQSHGMIMPRTAALTRTFDHVLLPLLRGARRRYVLTDAEQAGLAVLLPGSPTSRLANAVAVPAVAPRCLNAIPQVTFLARLHPRKRVLTFADLAQHLADTGVAATFTVYGPDEGDLTALTALMASSTASISYGGAVDHAAAQTILAASDVYVLPSVDEPFPMSVLEAMAVATPVVLVDTCGLAGPLAGRAGAQVTDATVEQLAEAVRRLLSDPARWREASADARRAAVTLFSLDAVVDQVLTGYED